MEVTSVIRCLSDFSDVSQRHKARFTFPSLPCARGTLRRLPKVTSTNDTREAHVLLKVSICEYK